MFVFAKAGSPPLVTGGARGIGAATASLASLGLCAAHVRLLRTKARVEAVCNSLSIEVARYDVEVAAIHPSWVGTDMVRTVAPQMERAFEHARAEGEARGASVSDRAALQLTNWRKPAEP